MPITYNAVTKISNGQAITADVLNTPSDGLEARTDEVLRKSKYEDFILKHAIATKAVLTPTLEPNVEPIVTINHHLKNNGLTLSSENLRSYSVGLDNAVLSVYSETVPGSRFIVPGTVLASFFSDSSSYAVESNNLHVPGDALYLKIATKQFTSGEVGTFADMYLPGTETKSKSNTYVTSPTLSVSASQIAKLPLRSSILLIFSSTVSVSSFQSHLEGADGFAAQNITVTINSTTNVISITDSSSNVFKLLVSGIQGARCEVHKVYTEETTNYLILEVVGSTAPVYSELDKIPISGVELILENSGGTTFNEANPIIDASTRYVIDPLDLDPAFMYIPIIRLTETTMEVGDKSFSLIRNYVQDGSSTDVGVIGTEDTYGAPIEYQDPSMTVGTKAVYYNLLTPKPSRSSRYYSIEGVFSTVLAGKITANFSRTKEFQAMLAAMSIGETLGFTGGEVKILEDVTTTNSLSPTINLEFDSILQGSAGSSILNIDKTNLPLSLFTKYSEINWSPAAGDTNTYTVSNNNQLPIISSTCSFRARNTDALHAITGGALYIKLDFYIK